MVIAKRHALTIEPRPCLMDSRVELRTPEQLLTDYRGEHWFRTLVQLLITAVNIGSALRNSYLPGSSPASEA